MTNLTPQDVAIRLYYSKCCVGDEAGKLANKLKRGSSKQEFERKLNLLSALVEVIEGYCPLDELIPITEEDNFITDAQAQHIFQTISELCGICFAPIGHNYE